MTNIAQLDRAKRAARLVGLIVPGIVLVASVAVQLIWLPRIPNPAATHWGPSGLPDGFGAPWTNLVLFAVLSLVTLFLPQLQLLQQRGMAPANATGTWASANRWLPAFALGLVVSLQTNALGVALTQLDAADARETGSTLGWLIGGWVAGAAVGVVGYLLQPRVRIDPETGEPTAQALPLGESERAAWVGEIRPSRGVAWGLAAVNLLVAAMTAWMFTVEPLAGWISLGVFALVAVSTGMCMWFSVRISSTGFEARSRFGWPVFRVQADDVADVVTARIEPLGEFGGWGLRFAGGRTGIVPRGGEGIVITKRSGKVLVATLDGAEEAAAVLAAAAAKAPESAAEQAAEPIEGDSQ